MRQNGGVTQRNIILFDCIIAALAPIAAVYLRGLLESRFDISAAFIPYAATSALATVVLLWWLGVSRALWSYFAFSDATRAVQAIAMGIGLGAIVGFATDRLDSTARSIPFIQMAFQSIMFVAARELAKRVFADSDKKPARPGGVLVVGCNRTAETYVRAVELLSGGSLEVVGVLAEDASMVGLTLRGRRILGTIDQAADVLQTLQVHGMEVEKIVLALPASALQKPGVSALLCQLRDTKLQLVHVDDLFGDATKVEAEPAALHPARAGAFGRYAFLKSCVDVGGSLVLLFLTSPLFVAVACLTLVDVGRPIYFWQQRMGRRGRGMLLYKFRTMRRPVDACGNVLPDSERTSAIGHFLRQTRLDELPQLIHILKGEMSFVGPRPLLPMDQPQEIMERLSVRPGLTGWAQVNGGKLVTPEDKRALDLYYVAHASLWMDLKIAWMTAQMFARGDAMNRTAIDQAHRWLATRVPPESPPPAGLRGVCTSMQDEAENPEIKSSQIKHMIAASI